MTYHESLSYLNGIRLFGQRLELDTVRELLRRMGNPQEHLRFIHIAGTNGKGSVAAMCHAVLTAAGYRNGLYTSPHLVSFCERFQIGGQPIAETEVARLVEIIRPLAETVGTDNRFRQSTFFEIVTAMALQYFADQRVEIVVWETGLGGRLDATNVVTPLVSVITNIALDHTRYLGETVAQIAGEKAGIIKPGVPVVTAADGEALAVIRRTCDENNASLIIVSDPERGRSPQTIELSRYGSIAIPLIGAHQRLNCATAVAALEASGLNIPVSAMRSGLARTSWPGRFQIVAEHPTVILDGAHNPAGAMQLAATLGEYCAGRKLSLILGVLRDKDYEKICHVLAPLAGHVYCVPVANERTSDPAQLAVICREANAQAQVSVNRNVSDAYYAARQDNPNVILIAGSLFLIGEAMGRLGFGSARSVSDMEMALQ